MYSPADPNDPKTRGFNGFERSNLKVCPAPNPLANKTPPSGISCSVWWGMIPFAPTGKVLTISPYCLDPGEVSITARKSESFRSASPTQTNKYRLDPMAFFDCPATGSERQHRNKTAVMTIPERQRRRDKRISAVNTRPKSVSYFIIRSITELPTRPLFLDPILQPYLDFAFYSRPPATIRIATRDRFALVTSVSPKPASYLRSIGSNLVSHYTLNIHADSLTLFPSW